MSNFTVESPLGKALQERVLPKLVELGWSTGMQDDTLSEYIVLMIANGGDEAQIASELSSDLLSTEPDDPAPANFAKWLFEQLAEIRQLHGAPTGAPASANIDALGDAQMDATATGDAEMGEDGSGVIPTGPKAMRNGQKSTPRDKRMLGQLNKTLDRSSDSALHRVRGTGGTGRINSHSREPPKGPRQTNVARNLAAGAGRGMAQNMVMGGPMGPMPFPQQNGAPGQIGMEGNAMQQMMQMFERQAQMMAQLTNSMPGFQGGMQGNGRPANDRMEKRGARFNQNRRHEQHSRTPATDTEMGEDGQPKEGGSTVGEERKDPATIMCRYNKACSNPECKYAHSGPVTFNGVPVDTTVDCTHAAACKNTRCALRHPSPAKKAEYHASVPCKFGAYCTNTACSFQHPNNLPCKNGADCKDEGCTFWHNPVMCKYPQCTNKNCPYKHAEGQKRGFYKSNQLVLNPDAVEFHVSDRKFVQDGQEELVVPGSITHESTSDGMEVIT